MVNWNASRRTGAGKPETTEKNKAMPHLQIYYSDKIEELANHLKESLVKERKAPDADPFVFSTVVVPNTNLSKWLRIRMFGDTPSLCMGIEFPFIENALFELLAKCLPAEGRPKLLPMNAYSTGILSILLKREKGTKGEDDNGLARDDFEALAPFRRYVADGKGGPLSIKTREEARMAWQLSSKLADLMDKYEVYRYKDIVEKWLDGHGAKGDKAPVGVEAAEATLARLLFGKGGLYPPDGMKLSLRQLFERVREKRPPDGKPIYFFGLSTLSPLQAEILYWLAKTRDIVFYHYNVCLEYWGDIETKKEEASVLARLKAVRRTDADKDVYAEKAPAPASGKSAPESSLLRQWGRAGRETLRLFVDLEEGEGTALDELPSATGTGTTMLQKVQASVRNRMDKVGRVAEQDASIQIVAAPGIRREVETVHNAIIGAVWKPKTATGERPWSDCKFSDIAVLVPDMATYRPVIEAVFDGRGQIPYALIDTAASEDSAYLQGFLGLMTLARDGLSRETLFALLDNPCVQRALSFGPDDAAEWRRYAEGVGAFDGFENKGDFGNMSWDPALRRLRLGRVAEGRDDLSVWDGGDDESALKFSAIVETLHRELHGLAWEDEPKNCLEPEAKKRLCARPPEERDEKGGDPTWADELRRIANEFLAVERDDKLEGPVKGEIFRTLSSLHAVEGRQVLDFVVTAVEESVGGVKSTRGGYLTNGVTVAGLHPMRPVPFKQVFVLGMGEGMFPGRDSATTLDIPGAARSLGDVQPTAVKKLLFLETMMAVKERLVLSYPCLDPVKDAELFPSGMVCELEKFLSHYVLPTKTGEDGKETNTAFREVRAPVLERAEEADFLHHAEGLPEKDIPEDQNPVGPVVWHDDWCAGLFPTYSDVERRIARGEAAVRDGAADTTGGRVTIKTDGLADFLKSPLRAALQHLHGIGVEGYKDGSIDPEAPLEIPYGPVQWEFNRALLDAAAGGAPNVEDVYAPFAASGKLPETAGFFGAYTVDKLSKDLEGAKSAALMELKNWVDGFLPENWEKPDPVRTVLSAKGGSVNTKPLPERLFTARTKDWKTSGGDSRVLLFKPCGDTGPGEDKRTLFPPKAVLEPFVAWVAKVAGDDDDAQRTLLVGIADIEKRLHNAWKWTITPPEARDWLDEVSSAFLRYLDDPKDGTYLDFGYDKLRGTFVKAKKDGKISGTIPAKAEEWTKIADSFTKDWDFGDKGGFDNGLVIDETVGPMGRLPGEGDDNVTKGDADIVETRYKTWFKRIFDGERTEV